MISNYFIHLAIIIVIYIILTASLNMAIGYTGLVNLGHVAFYGIGAYASAILALGGVPYPLALLSGGALAAVAGALLAILTNRLRGDYLALATLAFSFVFYSVALNWMSLTRGPLGIPGIPHPTVFGWPVATPGLYLVLAMIIMALCLGMLWRLTHSRYGTLLSAVRDDAVGAAALGKNVFRIKCESLAISAFFAGVAGSVAAHYLQYIDPSAFYIADIVVVLTMVIVGGLASLPGSIIAAILFILLPELLRFIHLPPHMVGPSRHILYAIVLLLILRFRPRGICGRIDFQSTL